MASTNVQRAKHFCTQSKLFNFKVTWKIENFFHRFPDTEPAGSEILRSPVFSSSTPSQLIRAIDVHPYRDDKEKKLEESAEKAIAANEKHVGVFLSLQSMPVESKSVSTSYSILAVDGKDKGFLCREISLYEFTTLKSGYGWPRFISRSALKTNTEFYLPNGHLTLECCIKAHINFISPISKSATQLEICCKTMARMYEERLHCDMVLKSSGKRFRCHKSVLNSGSLYFKDLFQTKDLATHDMTDILNDIELDDLLRFIYTGSAINLDITCNRLFLEADKHGMDKLKEACESELLKKVRVDTALHLLDYAVKNGACRLKKAAAICIAES